MSWISDVFGSGMKEASCFSFFLAVPNYKQNLNCWGFFLAGFFSGIFFLIYVVSL